MKFLWIVAAVVSLYAAANTPAQADTSLYVCAPGAAVATTSTSCPFAINVRNAYYVQGGGDVVAYSPITHQAYDMFCTLNWTVTLNQWPWNQANAARCTGGSNADVWVW